MKEPNCGTGFGIVVEFDDRASVGRRQHIDL